eukprot:c15385_g1_i1.p1 GENE.c15385_g1_i1~~c15385_g1_i1.p1  ORF type:complete len:213 (+),score=32.40 c15385_g1_i1:48-686(+)
MRSRTCLVKNAKRSRSSRWSSLRKHSLVSGFACAQAGLHLHNTPHCRVTRAKSWYRQPKYDDFIRSSCAAQKIARTTSTEAFIRSRIDYWLCDNWSACKTFGFVSKIAAGLLHDQETSVYRMFKLNERTQNQREKVYSELMREHALALCGEAIKENQPLQPWWNAWYELQKPPEDTEETDSDASAAGQSNSDLESASPDASSADSAGAGEIE